MLVILCALPLILEPLKLYRTEMKLLDEIEGERLADWTFSEIKEKLLKNEIPWKNLPSKKGAFTTHILSAASLQIPGRSNKKIVQRKFSLKYRRGKEGLHGETYRIFDVNIYFEPRLSTRKKKKSKKTGEEFSDYRFKLTVRQMPKIDRI